MMLYNQRIKHSDAKQMHGVLDGHGAWLMHTLAQQLGARLHFLQVLVLHDIRSGDQWSLPIYIFLHEYLNETALFPHFLSQLHHRMRLAHLMLESID